MTQIINCNWSANGTWLGNARTYTNPSNNGNAVTIGRGQNSSGNRRYIQGYLDGMKISARKVYTLGTNFNVPTSQFMTKQQRNWSQILQASNYNIINKQDGCSYYL